MTRREAAGLLALAALPGCGFQLRRWELGAAFDTAYIDRARGVDLDRDLAQALTAAGLVMAESDATADVVLKLSRQRQEQRSVGIVRGRAAEAELSLEVAFAIASGDGRQLLPERVLRAERRASVDGDNILGSSAEQALLRQEMRADLIARMLRALGALAKADADQR